MRNHKALALVVSTAFASLIEPALPAGKPTEANILPLTYTCSSSLKFRAQDMTSAQFADSCAQLGTQEGDFHNRLETAQQPVDNDQNEDLRMVIFDNYNQYKRYGGRLYNISTNNGGIYIEGDASNSNNQASFYAHEADWLQPAFVIWNLRHEYVHYLDGRFDLKGNFSDYPQTTIWWSEGLAEYISKIDDNSDAVALINSAGANRSLSQVFATNYNNSSEEIYDWGYLGVRFMFERHMDEIRNLRAETRAANWSNYQSMLDNWAPSYESEWQTWLVNLAQQ